MKLKQCLAFMMILVLLASTACSGGSGSDGTTAADNAADSSTESATDSGDSGFVSDSAILPTPAGQLPVVEPGTEITLNLGVVATPLIADYDTNYYTQFVKEHTGVNIEFTLIPMDTATEKVSLALSTNDVKSLPDVYMNLAMASNGRTIFGPSYASYWYDQGMIIPMNDLIDEYGHYYQKALAVAKEQGYEIDTWMTSADGNMYSLPNFSASLTNSYPNKLWINQGWLDALDLPMPTTTEEFREVLRAFKNNDPNGNGKADEISFAGAKQTIYYGYDFIINAFIYNQAGATYNRMYVEDGIVKFAATTDEWREAMIYLRELSDEGLYYTGSFTQDLTTLQQMAVDENDILGTFEALGYDLVVNTDDQEIINRYNSVPALIGPKGKHYVTWNAPSPMAAAVITANCEYPEIAFRVIDFMMSEECAMINRYGQQGVNWEVADEGAVSYYGMPAKFKILENTWGMPGQNQHFFGGGPQVYSNLIATGVQWSGNEKEAGYIKALSVMKLDETGVVPDEYLANLVYNEEEAAIVSTYAADINTYILQSIANFVAGDWDPKNDEQWNAYVDEYDKMGLEEYRGALQSCYTRMKEK